MQPQPEVGAAPGPSPTRIAEIRSLVDQRGHDSFYEACIVDDLLDALDAAEADNARLHAALAPFAECARVSNWPTDFSGGDPAYWPNNHRPTIDDMRRAAAACGPLPKIEP